jgi:hypothetical protein
MEEEAIRVISQGPRWTPAMQNGKLVTSWKKLPVTFRVRNAGKAAPGDDAHAAIAAIGVESLDIQLRSATEMISADGVKLDPSALYVGIDNRILVSGSVPIDNLHAEISQGTITRQGDYFVARVTQPGDAAIIITGKGQAGKSVGLKKVVFKTKFLTPPAEDPFSKTPKISVRELHAIDVATFLKVPSGAQVESFTFTIDQDNGDIVATHNTKDVFSPATRQQMRQAAPGRLITIDNIRVSVGGVSRKIPSQVYQVVP